MMTNMTNMSNNTNMSNMSNMSSMSDINEILDARSKEIHRLSNGLYYQDNLVTGNIFTTRPEMNYDFPHYCNTGNPYIGNLSLEIDSTLFTLPAQSIDILNNMVVGLNYKAETTTYYDSVLPDYEAKLTRDILCGRDPYPKPSPPQAIQLKVISFLLNDIQVLLSAPLSDSVVPLIYKELDSKNILQTMYGYETIRTVSGSVISYKVKFNYNGIRKFVEDCPEVALPSYFDPIKHTNFVEQCPININRIRKKNDVSLFLPDQDTYPGCDYYEICSIDILHDICEDVTNNASKIYRRVYTQCFIDKMTGELTYNPADVTPNPLIVAYKDRAVRIRNINLLDNESCIFTSTSLMSSCDKMGKLLQHDRTGIHSHGTTVQSQCDGEPFQWFGRNGDNGATFSTRACPDMVPPPNDPTGKPYSFADIYIANDQSSRPLFLHDHTSGLTQINVASGLSMRYLVVDKHYKNAVKNNLLPMKIFSDFLSISDIIVAYQPYMVDRLSPTYEVCKQLYPKLKNKAYQWKSNYPAINQNPNSPDGCNGFGRMDYGPFFWPIFPSLYGVKEIEDLSDPLNPVKKRYPSTPITGVTPETFGDSMVVNGKLFPRKSVQPTQYLFHIHNSCNDRSLNLTLQYAISNEACSTLDDFGNVVDIFPNSSEPLYGMANNVSNIPEGFPIDGHTVSVPYRCPKGIKVIGNETGFLKKVVELDNNPLSYIQVRQVMSVLDIDHRNLFLCPGERATCIMDFSDLPVGTVVLLMNDCPCPSPGFDPRNDIFVGMDSQLSGGACPSPLLGYAPNSRTVMKFIVESPTVVQNPLLLDNLENTIKHLNYHSTEPPYLGTPDDTFLQLKHGIDCFKEEQVFQMTDGKDGYVKSTAIMESALVEPSIDPITKKIKAEIINPGEGHDISDPGSIKIDIDYPDSYEECILTTSVANTSLSSINIVDINNYGYYTSNQLYISPPDITDIVFPTLESYTLGPNGEITSIRLSSSCGFSGNPIITISSPVFGVTATAVLTVDSNTCIQRILTMENGGITNSGSGYDYTTYCNITITPDPTNTLPELVQAVAETIVNGTGNVIGINLINPGSGYSKSPIVKCPEPDILPNLSSVVFGDGVVTKLNCKQSGSDYINPSITISDGFGRDALIYAEIDNSTGIVSSLRIIRGGYAYKQGTTVIISPPTNLDGTPVVDGIQATATIVLNSFGTIISASITNPGKGYICTIDFVTAGNYLNLPTVEVIPFMKPTDAYPTLSCNLGIGEIEVNNISGLDYHGVFSYDDTFTFQFAPPVSGETLVGSLQVVDKIGQKFTIKNKGSNYTEIPVVVDIIDSKGVSIINQCYDPPRFSLNLYKIGSVKLDILTYGSGLTTSPIIKITEQTPTIDVVDPVTHLPVATPTVNFDLVAPRVLSDSQPSRPIEKLTLASYYFNSCPITGIKEVVIEDIYCEYSKQIKCPQLHITCPKGFSFYRFVIPYSIQELFDQFGMMNATYALEVPASNSMTQTTLPIKYNDPLFRYEKFEYNISNKFMDCRSPWPMWKINHNGVDNHSIHFHCIPGQLHNRIGWDNTIGQKDAGEFGNKDIFRANPLNFMWWSWYPKMLCMDNYALRDMIRPNHPNMEVGMTSTLEFSNYDEQGNPVTMVNEITNYYQECMTHCHLLGHEENDFMRPFSIYLHYESPYKADLTLTILDNIATFVWNTPTSPTNRICYDQRDWYDIQLQVSDDPYFKTYQLVADVDTTFLLIKTSTTFTCPIPDKNKIYFWRVCNVNRVGPTASNVVYYIPNLTTTLSGSYLGVSPNKQTQNHAVCHYLWQKDPAANDYTVNVDIKDLNNNTTSYVIPSSQITYVASTSSYYCNFDPLTTTVPLANIQSIKATLFGSYNKMKLNSSSIFVMDWPLQPLSPTITFSNPTNSRFTVNLSSYTYPSTITITNLSAYYTLSVINTNFNYTIYNNTSTNPNFVINKSMFTSGTTYHFNASVYNGFDTSPDSTVTYVWSSPSTPILSDITLTSMTLQENATNLNNIDNTTVTVTINNITNSSTNTVVMYTKSILLSNFTPLSANTLTSTISDNLGISNGIFKVNVLATNVVGSSTTNTYTVSTVVYSETITYNSPNINFSDSLVLPYSLTPSSTLTTNAKQCYVAPILSKILNVSAPTSPNMFSLDITGLSSILVNTIVDYLSTNTSLVVTVLTKFGSSVTKFPFTTSYITIDVDETTIFWANTLLTSAMRYTINVVNNNNPTVNIFTTTTSNTSILWSLLKPTPNFIANNTYSFKVICSEPTITIFPYIFIWNSQTCSETVTANSGYKGNIVITDVTTTNSLPYKGVSTITNTTSNTLVNTNNFTSKVNPSPYSYSYTFVPNNNYTISTEITNPVSTTTTNLIIDVVNPNVTLRLPTSSLTQFGNIITNRNKLYPNTLSFTNTVTRRQPNITMIVEITRSIITVYTSTAVVFPSSSTNQTYTNVIPENTLTQGVSYVFTFTFTNIFGQVSTISRNISF
jgi:FtsP/CotA-like multicopper oxidase with cupredoxin domain